MPITANYVNGRLEVPPDAETFRVVNPATGQPIADVVASTPQDVESALDAAAKAFPAWSGTPADERGRIIRGAAEIMRRRMPELSRVLTCEQGKPLDQAVGEINYGLGFLDWFAEEGRRVYGMTVPLSTSAKRGLVLRQPLGVTVSITPWNFPAAQLLRKLGAALAAGCTMVAKPAELTPLSALEIARAFGEAGLPPGVFSVVCAPEPFEFTDVVMRDPRVRAITFTGSTEVGKILMRRSADTVKRVSLELGGHAPLIVFEDADVDLAVRETLGTKVRNMGQTCVSVNRVYVHESIEREYVERLTAAMSRVRLGNGLDPGTEMGPLIGAEAVDKVQRHVDDAIAHGAKVQTGGVLATSADLRGGLYFEPTVLSQVEDHMLVAREETFGPVAPVLTFADEEDVIRRANSTPYGLAAYFFTENLRRAVRVAEALEYGAVGVNDATTAAVQAPFGGFKESGIGREGGPLGIEEFLETKYVSLGGLAR
jgi:succinate-semialdehyde dehydrogenase/glutarate-semialdehyde dehydrogenase